jgi:hypothetical protein
MARFGSHRPRARTRTRTRAHANWRHALPTTGRPASGLGSKGPARLKFAHHSTTNPWCHVDSALTIPCRLSPAPQQGPQLPAQDTPCASGGVVVTSDLEHGTESGGGRAPVCQSCAKRPTKAVQANSSAMRPRTPEPLQPCGSPRYLPRLANRCPDWWRGLSRRRSRVRAPSLAYMARCDRSRPRLRSRR